MFAARRESDSMDADLNLADEVDFIKGDVGYAVEEIVISEKLPESDGRIYINIQTKEKKKFCVELSKAGFRVVGCDFDNKSNDEEEKIEKTYETIYSLLAEISSSYCSRFGAELSRKLSLLKEDNLENKGATTESK